jgi:hypothetical protein
MTSTTRATRARWPARRILLLLAALAIGLLISLAGKHALEARLGDGRAIVVSHLAGLAVVIAILRRSGRHRDSAA